VPVPDWAARSPYFAGNRILFTADHLSTCDRSGARRDARDPANTYLPLYTVFRHPSLGQFWCRRPFLGSCIIKTGQAKLQEIGRMHILIVHTGHCRSLAVFAARFRNPRRGRSGLSASVAARGRCRMLGGLPLCLAEPPKRKRRVGCAPVKRHGRLVHVPRPPERESRRGAGVSWPTPNPNPEASHPLRRHSTSLDHQEP